MASTEHTKDTQLTGMADMPAGDAGEIRMALARAVASRKVPDDAIAAVADRLARHKLPIRGIDICAYGICIDYFFTDDRWSRVLPEILKLKGSHVHSITVFPWGIPVPDLFRVRVEQQFEELGGAMGR